MATRFSRLNYNWASDSSSFVVDPDDDPDHPSGEGGDNKYIRGWVVETEPNEWENYVIKRQDDIEMQKLINGWEISQDPVSYKFGAVALYNGIPQMYISVTEFTNPIMDEDSVTNLYTEYLDYLRHEGVNDRAADEDWTPILCYSKSDYDNITNDMHNEYIDHLTALNPHAVEIGAIGGYTMLQIDSNIGVVITSYNAHIYATNPHVDTAINVGTIPSTGGTFTGQVNYMKFIPFGAPPLGGEVTFDSDKFLVANDQTSAVGLGTGDYQYGGKWQRILCANTYTSFASSYNGFVRLPLPDLRVDMKYDLKTNKSTGVNLLRNSILGYTNRKGEADSAAVNMPAFELSGLKLSAATGLWVDAPELLGASEGTVAYVLNNVLHIEDVHFLSENLTYYFGNAGNVRCFKYWAKRLTMAQKLSVPT